MDWTEELWLIWEELNEGEINWRFINNDNVPLEKRNEVIDMVVRRGFVNPLPTGERPQECANNWVVKDAYNKTINPSFEGKTWYFTKEKYALGYVDYRESFDTAGGKLSVKEVGVGALA